MSKNSGAYYTPSALANFIVEHCIKNFPSESNSFSILEPSCGDGVFVRLLEKVPMHSLKPSVTLDAYDTDLTALKVARTHRPRNFASSRFYNRDWIASIASRTKKKYDLIIGNPPYVIRKRLSDIQTEHCLSVYREAGIAEGEFKNLWGAFLVGATRMLAENGLLAFVLPAELLQVKFAFPIRRLLLERFDRIDIVTFRDVVFENIGQDTVVLFCFKKSIDKGVFLAQCKDLETLSRTKPAFRRKKLMSSPTEKWTGHVLSNADLSLLRRLKDDFPLVSDYCTSVAGIVTAANSFFIVNESELKKLGLEEFAVPIVQKGHFVNGSVRFDSKAYEQIRLSARPCFLLDFNGVPKSNMTLQVRDYLHAGEKMNLDKRYKCLKRKPWYAVPGIWKSEGIFFKRCHEYPKILSNQTSVMVTDSAYRIQMKEGFDIDSMVSSFYNSLTLALAEVEGRSYGGGVLELTPNEFKTLPLPYQEVTKHEFDTFSSGFESKSSIDSILDVNDERVLGEGFGLSKETIRQLRKIRAKLSSRRLSKKNS